MVRRFSYLKTFFGQNNLVNFCKTMDKVLKRVTHHKKQNTNSGVKLKDNINVIRSSSINKRYSVDDNFYTYDNKGELYHQNCNGNNFYTISNRGDFKRNTTYRSKSVKQENSMEKQLAREDVTFKKFLKVFNTGENSRGARDWFSSNASNMMDFAPKILTKRFCGKKAGDNELYRSNSFKFERFERTDSETLTTDPKKSPISRQISLCDDYSLPVDFVNKRPLSLDSGSFWSAQSPNGDQVEVLNLYCDPKDSKSQQSLTDKIKETKTEVPDCKIKFYSTTQKEYCHPYADTSDDGEHEDDEPELYENLKHRKLTALSAHSRSSNKSNTYTEVRKSPYYYGDLLKRSQSEDQPERHRFESNSYRKCQSLDVANGSKQEPIYSNDLKYFDPSASQFGIEEEEEEEDEDMASKQRHMYETAFDSKICRSSEILELDAVTNHLLERCSPQLPFNPAFCSISNDRKCSLKRMINSKNNLNSSNNKFESSMDSLTLHLTDLDITEQSTLLHGYSSASTSTIPLPQSVSSHLNDSLDSFSESSHKGNRNQSDKIFQNKIMHHRRIKDTNNLICCNNKNNNNNDNNNSSSSNRNKNINNINNRHHRHHKHKVSQCYGNEDDCCVSESPNDSRPKSCHLPSKILEIKGRPRGSHKFSSTESMTTSSSGGSLESIRSSTSEGNRSTTSTDSHRSSSLSSHSSDSAVGSGGYNFSINFPLGSRFLNQNKIHVLSPISDKSFQEPGSESSEINRNNNSQKASPEENKCTSPDGQPNHSDTTSVHKTKRRPLQNKNVVNLSLPFAPSADTEAHHCSDSGISIESRSDTAKLPQNSDFNDLPFDMPKLRRRRLQQMQMTQNSTQDTSSSATSVDLKDLPFDMPKLRRKLRSSSTQESVELPLDSNSAAATYEEQSGDETNKQPGSFDQGKNRKSLGLSLNLNEIIPAGYNIDGDLPLERQGWYHGAITRMDAENELRNREEGSYLVRNSESAKHDYSLSLKSAKGFMHMRIQKSIDTNKFILGQFSSPFDSIPQMIKHFSSNQLPIRGAEHMCLLQPVIAQLL